MIRYHVMASGHVQGVGFRASCQSFAEELGLMGYAKNLSDGRVEIEVQGEKPALDEFLRLIQDIPPGSKAAIDVDQIACQIEQGFYIKT